MRFIIFLIIVFWSAEAADDFIKVNIVEKKLDNGLKILMYEEHSSPQVICRLTYKAGSVNEYAGISGISHMLEHMMFKGTKDIGTKNAEADSAIIKKIDNFWEKLRQAEKEQDSASKEKYRGEIEALLKKQQEISIPEELWQIYMNNGGGAELNAFTSDLLTNYIVTLPSEKLELFMWLESDRMANAVFREFYPEKNVVAEERRMRYESSPKGRYFESLFGIFYEAHPKRIPTIGYASDIENYTREMVKRHYDKYYVPANALMVIAGDIDTAEVMRLAKKYFGGIPGGSSAPEITTKEPVQVGQKRFLQEKEVSPQIDILFHTPGYPNKDLYAVDVLETVLSGLSGRLHKELVIEKGIAGSAGAMNYLDKYESTFRISVSLKRDSAYAEAEEAVFSIIKDIQRNGISSEELEKAKNRVLMNSVSELRDLKQLANEMAFWEVYGDWRYINEFPKGVSAVKKEEVKETAKKYLTFNNSTVGWIGKNIQDKQPAKNEE
ncbi:MAG: M16 family metallopeptidase [Fibrobacterota bacterium]